LPASVQSPASVWPGSGLLLAVVGEVVALLAPNLKQSARRLCCSLPGLKPESSRRCVLAFGAVRVEEVTPENIERWRATVCSAARAGVRRRFAPHELRHAHAVEMAREGVELAVARGMVRPTSRLSLPRTGQREDNGGRALASRERQRRPWRVRTQTWANEPSPMGRCTLCKGGAGALIREVPSGRRSCARSGSS
jgi:hypothetical protein